MRPVASGINKLIDFFLVIRNIFMFFLHTNQVESQRIENCKLNRPRIMESCDDAIIKKPQSFYGKHKTNHLTPSKILTKKTNIKLIDSNIVCSHTKYSRQKHQRIYHKSNDLSIYGASATSF